MASDSINSSYYGKTDMSAAQSPVIKIAPFLAMGSMPSNIGPDVGSLKVNQ